MVPGLVHNLKDMSPYVFGMVADLAKLNLRSQMFIASQSLEEMTVYACVS